MAPCQDHCSYFVICTHKVEGYECKPMNGVDAVGEENESCLIESSGTLSCFESIKSCRNDEQKGKEETGHKTRINPCKM